MKRLAVLFFVVFAFVSLCNAQKKRVAVMNFDYSTVHSYVLGYWGGADVDIGKGIADLLVVPHPHGSSSSGMPVRIAIVPLCTSP